MLDEDFAAIAKRMKELQLDRDKPFDQPLQPDFHAELNAKLQPKAGQYDQAGLEKLHSPYRTIEEIEAAYGSY
jgi:hypothetical protein